MTHEEMVMTLKPGDTICWCNNGEEEVINDIIF